MNEAASGETTASPNGETTAADAGGVPPSPSPAPAGPGESAGASRGSRVTPLLPWLLLLSLIPFLLISRFELPELSHVNVVETRARISGLATRVRFSGGGRITPVGRLMEEPLQVEVIEDASGSPVAAVPVEFMVFTRGAHLVDDGEPREQVALRTNRSGRAAAYLRPPRKVTGEVWVRARVLDPDSGEVVAEHRPLIHAIDSSALLFAFLGGISIFLFGMKLMTAALQAIAGDRLRSVLESLTRRRVVGLAAGAFITALIQSSSATSVMTVGLVNAGLLSLKQAVPVMFGANIGTTITGQLIAFKIKHYAFPMMFVGLMFQFLGGTRRRQLFGEVVFGLGMLFAGMSLMEGVFKPLTHSAEFRSVFVAFSFNPLYGVMAGAVVTCLVQSSSATVGLTLALASSGFLDLQGAFALVLGDNIGTTITAVLASLGGRAPARRAALVHTLFNVSGAVVMLSLLYVPWDGHPVYLALIDRITAGDAFASPPMNIERHVANSHTFFNVCFALVFLPLSHRFAQAATWMIPEEEAAPAPSSRLAPNLLHTPPVAMHSCQLEMAGMAGRLEDMFSDAMGAFFEDDVERLEAVHRGEAEIDDKREEVSGYLVRISEHELSPADAERIPRLLHAVNDLERFGDLAEELAKLARRKVDKQLPFSEVALGCLAELQSKVALMLGAGRGLLEHGGKDRIHEIRVLEQELNHLEDRTRRSNIKRMRGGECNPISGIVFLDMLTVLEKMGDYLENVADALEPDA